MTNIIRDSVSCVLISMRYLKYIKKRNLFYFVLTLDTQIKSSQCAGMSKQLNT